MFLSMMRTPTRNILMWMETQNWLQEIPDHVKSCKHNYFLLALL